MTKNFNFQNITGAPVENVMFNTKSYANVANIKLTCEQKSMPVNHVNNFKIK